MPFKEMLNHACPLASAAAGLYIQNAGGRFAPTCIFQPAQTPYFTEHAHRLKELSVKRDFEAQKEALLKEIRTVLSDMESLYEEGVERGAEETKALKVRLQERLSRAQDKLAGLEERTVTQVRHHAKQADEYIHEKPYYALGFAALAGLVVGVLLNRR